MLGVYQIDVGSKVPTMRFSFYVEMFCFFCLQRSPECVVLQLLVTSVTTVDALVRFFAAPAELRLLLMPQNCHHEGFSFPFALGICGAATEDECFAM